MAWGSKNKQDGQGDGPPDLDEVFKKITGKLRRGKSNSSDSSGGSGHSDGSDKSFWLLSAVVIVVLAVIWALSGIYFVQPAERGVILRFGKYQKTVTAGMHWYPRFIDSKYIVNVESVESLQLSQLMLTRGENIVSVAFALQYRVGDVKDYLFNVIGPEQSLRQIVDSAVRQVIGTSQLDNILTTERQSITQRVQKEIQSLIDRYQNGIKIVNVKMEPAKAPDQVKPAFDDVIKAREDNQRLQNQATSYANRVVPVAEGKSKRILQQADAYKQQAVFLAKGDVAQFNALLPKYQLAPKVTKERMYLETMEKSLGHSHVVLVDTGKHNNNLLYLPLGQNMQTPGQNFLKQAKQNPRGSQAHNTDQNGSHSDSDSGQGQQGSQQAQSAPNGQDMALNQAYMRWKEAQQ